MKKLILLLLVVLFLAACSATVQRSADTLKLTQQSVVSIADTVDQMCSSGALTQKQCDEAGHLYAEAKKAYADALAAEMIVIDAAIAGTGQNEAESNYALAVGSWTSVAAEMVSFATRLNLLEE